MNPPPESWKRQLLQWTTPSTDSKRAEPMHFAEPRSPILLPPLRALTLTLHGASVT
jgi:hypothetical protein